MVFSSPISILFILNSKKIYKSYKMSPFRKLKLGFKMMLNNHRIPSGTTYLATLAMALKILETPPDVPGDVMECGTFKGGSSANLSLVCRIVGRKLKIYDSFEGLPEAIGTDRDAVYHQKGDYTGALDEVKENIRRYGAIECCEFIKGWFEDTLPELNSPVLLAYLDVDLKTSLYVCVKSIWPNLVDNGYVFTDEYVGTHYIALFYSEKWWQKNFNTTPPGLIGAGSGLPLGQYYIGPWEERDEHPLQASCSTAYTQKNLKGYWDYYPEGDL